MAGRGFGWIAAGIAFAVCAALVGSCGGGGYGGGAPTSPSSSAPTITLTSSGASPQTLRVNTGQRVMFVNNDSRMHEMLSVPHLLHTDCPALNDVGSLSPGASRQTGTLSEARSCGFHDHLNPDDQRFRGQILVGNAEPPPSPIYSGPR